MVSESCFHSVLHRKSLTYVRHRKPFTYCTESPLKTAQCTVLANCPMGPLDTAQCTVQSESFSYCIESMLHTRIHEYTTAQKILLLEQGTSISGKSNKG